MKSKRKKKILAAILCMVMVLTNNFSILAEGTEVPNEIIQPETPEQINESETEVIPEESKEETPESEVTPQEPETEEMPQEEATPEEPKVEEVPQEEATPEKPKTEEVPQTEETPKELKYEDEQVSVVVTAVEEGAIPTGATLKVLPITLENNETKAQYEDVEKRIQEKVAEEEKEVAGFLAYDITFVDGEGNEIEPNSKVKVSMNYKKAALPEDVKENGGENAEVSVLHLEEDENGNVKDVVNMSEAETTKVDALTTTEGPMVQNVEMETESFSVFTITWKNSERGLLENTYKVKWIDHGGNRQIPTVTIHFVDENGKNISKGIGVKDKDIIVSGNGNLDGIDRRLTLQTIGEKYNEQAKTKGFYFAEAHIDSYKGNITTNISYNPNVNTDGWLYLPSNGGWTNWNGRSPVSRNVYMVYKKIPDKYQVVWADQGDNNHRPTVTLHFVDAKGNDISKKLNVTNRTIHIPGTGNLSGNNSLNKIGETYNNNNLNLCFTEAHIDSYAGTVATNISYNLSANPAGGWLYQTYGSDYIQWDQPSEKLPNERDVYLVYGEKKAVEKIKTLDETNPNDAKKIKINLFNYNKNINNTKAANEGFQFHNSEPGTAVDGANSVHPDLKYTHPNGTQKVHQEYLKKNLSKENYPVLNNGTSLKYLFDETDVRNGVTAYKDLTGLLYKEGTYNVYDSERYHAQLEDNKIAVYNARLSPAWNTFSYGNFLPFNRLSDNMYNGTNNSVPSGRGKTDLWFGMNLDFKFMQPKDGKIADEPMVFDFRGDDDVWVFIDGIKVLDIGGIHPRKAGSINFNTGVVKVEGINDTTLPELYKEAYIESYKESHFGKQPSVKQIDKYLSGIFKKDANDEYTTYKNFDVHDFKFFYLERGAGASNCRIKFNMPAVNAEDIIISKEIEDYDENAYNDIEFSYELWVGDELQKGVPYTLIDADGKEESKKTDPKTGIFKLKHGESARFSQYKEGEKYKVKEVGISSGTYDKVTIQSSGIVDENNLNVSDNNSSAVSRDLVVGENPSVKFLNRCAVTNIQQLIIEKKLENGDSKDVYNMRVTVGGKPYRGYYKVGDNYDAAMEAEPLEAKEGIVSLKANQVAVVLGNVSRTDNGEVKRGFPSGTSFKVEELLAEGGSYIAPHYEIEEKTADDGKTKDGFDGIGYASGKIALKTDAKVIVTNTMKGTAPDPDTPEDVLHHKYIDYLGSGENTQTSLSREEFYRLYLDVKGVPNIKPEPADIVLVLDYSSSMDSDFGKKDRFHYVKESAKLAVNTLLPKGSENRVGIVWFDRRANDTEFNVDFTNDKNTLLTNIEKKDWDSGTNYQAAFWNAQDMLEKQSSPERKKFVIFVTDGRPYDYYTGTKGQQKDTYLEHDSEKAKKAAKEAAKLFKDLSGFYAVSVGDEGGTTFLKDEIVPAVPAAIKKVIGADSTAELEKAFNVFLGSITKQIGNVTITDTLSDYVDFVDETGNSLEQYLEQYANEKGIIEGKQDDRLAVKLGLKVQQYDYDKFDDDDTNKTEYDKHTGIKDAQDYTGEYTYTIDLKTKKITVNLGKDYFLERDKVYTISFNVKLTEAATQEAVDANNMIGDANTDYPGNDTSSGKKGLYSNTEAKISFERVKDGEIKPDELTYEKPVVQPYERVKWDIVKVNEADTIRLKGAEFHLYQKDSELQTPVYKGISDENGVVKWEKLENNSNKPLNSSEEIEKGTYILSEVKAPVGYTLSGKKWEVTISVKGGMPVIKEQDGIPVKMEQDENGVFIMKVHNKAVYELPSSGGHGTFVYTIGGTLLLMAAALLLYKMKRKEVLKS